MQKLAWALMCGMFLCGAARAQGCKHDAKDEGAVIQAMKTLYAGATVDDMAMMHTVTAPGFYGFDGGFSYSSIDDLMKVVKADQDRGVKYVWNVTEAKVTVNCKDAWITYVNDGSVQEPGAAQAKPHQWLESAILKKLDGKWKILFFHSTFVRTPAPAK